jgi:hypothetical protein
MAYKFIGFSKRQLFSHLPKCGRRVGFLIMFDLSRELFIVLMIIIARLRSEENRKAQIKPKNSKGVDFYSLLTLIPQHLACVVAGEQRSHHASLPG